MLDTGAPHGDGRARRHVPGAGAVRAAAAAGRPLRLRRHPGEAQHHGRRTPGA